MASVRETKLPGVGVRHEFTTETGEEVAVLVHHDGRREIMVYDANDPDLCRPVMALSAADARTMNELLGASRVTEVVAAVQQELEGLAIEWIRVEPDSSAAGTTIGDGQFRTRTGCSIVAVIRGDTSIPAPGPDFAFEGGDMIVVVGTTDGLASVRSILQG